jgi:hypothetical protein
MVGRLLGVSSGMILKSDNREQVCGYLTPLAEEHEFDTKGRHCALRRLQAAK